MMIKISKQAADRLDFDDGDEVTVESQPYGWSFYKSSEGMEMKSDD